MRSLTENENIKSSKKVFDEIKKANKIWKSRNRLPHTLEGEIKVIWIPGHSGIEGNELADREAKKGATLSPQGDQPEHSFASLKKWHTISSQVASKNWWDKNIPSSYAQLEIRDISSFPRDLLLSRKALGRIISFRTGQGDFAPYHERFGHIDANTRCQCGSLKTRLHNFFCRIIRRRGHRPAGSINQLIPNLLGKLDGAISLTKWLDETKFFEQICPR